MPQLPVPNSATVLLTLTTDAKDTPYTLSVWAMDQGGLVSALPAVIAFTVASTGPVVSVLAQPAQQCGRRTVAFVLQVSTNAGQLHERFVPPMQ